MGLGNPFPAVLAIFKNVFIVKHVGYLYGVEIRKLQTISAIIAYFGGIEVTDKTVTAVVTDLLLIENAFFVDPFELLRINFYQFTSSPKINWRTNQIKID